ncbi:hypothetical protein HK405_015410 [Cladochytrium tenue]|nr:hypothetical protein HK405_015410 [Cladochytrium tenue]
MHCHIAGRVALLAAVLALAVVVLAAVATIGAPAPGPAPAPTRDSNDGGRKKSRSGTGRTSQPRQHPLAANRAGGTGGNRETQRSFIGRMTDRMFKRNKKPELANRPPTPHVGGGRHATGRNSGQSFGSGGSPSRTGGGGGGKSYQELHGLSNAEVQRIANQARIKHAQGTGDHPDVQPEPIYEPVTLEQEQEAHKQLNSFNWAKASEVRPRPNQEPVSPTDDRHRG